MCLTSLHAESCLECQAKRAGWFCYLPPSVLAEFEALSTHVLFPAGTILFTEGQQSRNVSIVCEGRIKLTKSSRDGKTLLVKIAKPGDVLGLSAALLQTPYEITAQAIDCTWIRTFQQQEFLRFVRRHVESSLNAAESLNHEYRSALNDACRLALSNSIAGRVAHLLLDLAEENGVAGNSQPEIRLTLKHEDIASMLGSSRESVTRVLSSFKRQGLISVHGARIKILRKEALEELL